MLTFKHAYRIFLNNQNFDLWILLFLNYFLGCFSFISSNFYFKSLFHSFIAFDFLNWLHHSFIHFHLFLFINIIFRTMDFFLKHFIA